jgi:hypothetical protein
MPNSPRHVLNLARADALDHGLLDYADQGLLAPLPMLDETRHVTAFAHLRHFQAERAQPRIPAPLAVTVAVPGAFLGPLMWLSADLLRDLRLHEKVQDHLRHCSHRVFGRTRGLDQLVRQLVPVYSVFGHPSFAPFVKAGHFHWSQQRLAFVKTSIYTQDFTRPTCPRLRALSARLVQ